MTQPEFTEKDITRFWSGVDQRRPDECWLWRGTQHANGYGVIGFLKRRFYAHRLAFLFTYGAIPDGYLICHRCDVPSCVNPAHLFAGTQRDNMQDAKDKGRTSPPPLNGEARRKLTMDDAREIRARYHAGESMPKLAAAFGMTWESIRTLLDNQSYMDSGYHRTRFRDQRKRKK